MVSQNHDTRARHRLSALLDPASIAVIGASGDANRIGGIALDHLSRLGYTGQVFPINPKYEELAGYRCYPKIEAVPHTPDVVVLALAVDDVMPMLRRCHAKHIGAAIVYAAGYAEVGGEGVQRQAELVAFARDSGMLIVGPNCMGLANLTSRAITTFVPTFRNFPPDDKLATVSLVTQSGSMCSDIYVTGWMMNMRFHYFINTGNEACLEFSDYLDFLVEDPKTDAIAGYLEGLRDGEHFIEVAARLRNANKPLVLLKAGESERGAQVTQSHTASLAGNRAIYRAAFRQLSVMQARHTVHLADIAYLTQFRHRQVGHRVVVASISGAMGAVSADLLCEQGFELPALSQTAQRKLIDAVPGIAMVCNPVDMTGQLFSREKLATEVLTTLLADEVADILFVFATGSLFERIAPQLIEVTAKSTCLVVVVATSGKAETRQSLEAAGIPVFPDAARASEALGTWVRWYEGRTKSEQWSSLRSAEIARTKRRAPLPLRSDEHEVKMLLAEFGVPVGSARVARAPQEACDAASAMGFPVAIKILSPDIAHKTEVGGVRLNLVDVAQVDRATREVIASVQHAAASAEVRGVLVQPMESGVCELIIGVTRDPVFGLSMTVGLGGVLTEVFQDVTHRLLPVDASIAKDMLQELRGYRLMQGFRGRPHADVEATAQAIAAVSRAAMALGDTLAELEINPLLVKAQGQGAVALDALLLTVSEIEKS